ncbi:hypothetical protein [Hymenobacter sp. YC55]|uniref:hypothetical protein n=1 Tax=Hymenobacter sp. YC55 TaxID=3034019 RepID=UPI0023F717A7|nr:hypothetical protein [Hymenobacter sp. YC55]MDF7815197.1 hypothetical protein [Hymenobacter sp. YC55]
MVGLAPTAPPAAHRVGKITGDRGVGRVKHLSNHVTLPLVAERTKIILPPVKSFVVRASAYLLDKVVRVVTRPGYLRLSLSCSWFMYATLLFELRQTLARLHAQPVPLAEPEYLTLRELLVATIRNLRALQAYTEAPLPGQFLRQRIHLLEQQAQALARPGKVAPGSWNLLHTYLTATLEATLQASPSPNPQTGNS